MSDENLMQVKNGKAGDLISVLLSKLCTTPGACHLHSQATSSPPRLSFISILLAGGVQFPLSVHWSFPLTKATRGDSTEGRLTSLLESYPVWIFQVSFPQHNPFVRESTAGFSASVALGVSPKKLLEGFLKLLPFPKMAVAASKQHGSKAPKVFSDFQKATD